MTYTIQEHKHRYAAWAASRAASTRTCRFSVLQGKTIIECIALNSLIADPELLPTPANMDSKHREWREAAIRAAENTLIGFSHGVAAKLINVYLKGAFVCAGHDNHPNVVVLHPPIYSLLLKELHAGNVGEQREQWAAARNRRWSKFTSEEYESVISAIKTAMGDSALWKIEAYWRGYQ